MPGRGAQAQVPDGLKLTEELHALLAGRDVKVKRDDAAAGVVHPAAHGGGHGLPFPGLPRRRRSVTKMRLLADSSLDFCLGKLV